MKYDEPLDMRVDYCQSINCTKLVQQDERLQLLISIVKRIKFNIVVVFPENQINFLQKLLILLGITIFRTRYKKYICIIIIYDYNNQLIKHYKYIMIQKMIQYLYYPQARIPNYTESKLEKNKQEQFGLESTEKNTKILSMIIQQYQQQQQIYQLKLDQHNQDVLKLNLIRLGKLFGFKVTLKLNTIFYKYIFRFQIKIKQENHYQFI
ncbi:unnamed protein product [Paramecium sonneborni]|uniref:Uncharacterized protein n=1 Tax=Paramecium sonneborni TaxID=65129 RepID=A0A8S1N9S7_9CILI|nr:unnamed protein product [Paramecium sonneborni]